MHVLALVLYTVLIAKKLNKQPVSLAAASRRRINMPSRRSEVLVIEFPGYTQKMISY